MNEPHNRQMIDRRQFVQMAGLLCAPVLLAGCGSGTGSQPAASTGSAVTAFDRTANAFDHARTPDEIVASGTLVVGVGTDAAPFAMIDGLGNFIGFDVEFGDLLGGGMGTAVRYVSTDPANVGPYLESNKIDAAICSTCEPDERVAVATPYFATQLALVATPDVSFATIHELVGQPVAVCDGTRAAHFLQEVCPDADLRVYPTYTAAGDALETGAVVALCLDQILARGWVNGRSGYEVILDDLGESSKAGVMVKAGNDALLERMNQETVVFVNDGFEKKAYDQHVNLALGGLDYTRAMLPVAAES